MTGEMIVWSLEDYAKEINEQYTVLLTAEETAENAIFRIGQLLNEVKTKLPHGKFIPWIRDNCHFNTRHAQKLMMIESRRDEFVEPPTSIKGALRHLEPQTQMRHPGRIWSSPQEAIPYENPRGKFYKKLSDIYDYAVKVEEEGYDKHMVMEDERATTAELLVRLIEKFGSMRNAIDPSRSHIREVKS